MPLTAYRSPCSFCRAPRLCSPFKCTKLFFFAVLQVCSDSDLKTSTMIHKRVDGKVFPTTSGSGSMLIPLTSDVEEAARHYHVQQPAPSPSAAEEAWRERGFMELWRELGFLYFYFRAGNALRNVSAWAHGLNCARGCKDTQTDQPKCFFYIYEKAFQAHHRRTIGAPYSPGSASQSVVHHHLFCCAAPSSLHF